MSGLKVDIDGREVEVAHGSTVMDAAVKLGIYVPHFCYHKKLSIAANCRMCLVEVEKAPKPLPACATPCTDGMKVKTHSPGAKKAQNGVMEFLLINHPLDCPICDQGGECQLQDLSMGYGKGDSRYAEKKRVVLHKDIGPLVAAEEMSRCIQCTRCVRFGQEIAGVMELGMVNRGERSEIVSFVGKSVDSELSGNMIDLCPVGALTSKPFRYSARTWELSRRKSVSPHDSHGANLVVQVKHDRVMRVLPLENESVNECWISDKDRFSYEALNSEERLTRPMVKGPDGWIEADWHDALDVVVEAIKMAGKDVGVLSTPQSTLEELHLAGQLAKKLGGASDFRLRRSDFSGDAARGGIPWLGLPIAQLGECDRFLVVGSFLRKDHPLIAHRLRQAAKRGAKINAIGCATDDWLMPISSRVTVAPSELPAALAKAGEGAIGESLKSGKKVAILLGNLAEQHAQAATLHALAHKLAESLGATLGFLGEGGNAVGGYVAGANVGPGTRAMLDQARKAYVLVNAEVELDTANPQAALAAMNAADFVVQLSAFKGRASDYANVILPIAPFTETAGAFVNAEGRVQSFHGCVKPQGEARPGWKVLRVLGTMLGLDGFEFDTAEQVRQAALGGRDVPSLLSNKTSAVPAAAAAVQGLQRIADVPIHFADAIARRAPSLQKTRDAQAPKAWMNARTMQGIGASPGQPVLVKQGTGEARLACGLDDGLPDQCVRVAAAHASTAALGAMTGTVTLQALASERAA